MSPSIPYGAASGPSYPLCFAKLLATLLVPPMIILFSPGILARLRDYEIRNVASRITQTFGILGAATRNDSLLTPAARHPSILNPPCHCKAVAAAPLAPSPARPRSLVRDLGSPSHSRASRNHLPPTPCRTSPPARSPIATGEPLPRCSPGCPSPAETPRASGPLPTWSFLGKGRAPTTGHPFPLPRAPRGPAPSRPAGRARLRVRERTPVHLLGASPRWPTCPQRRPGAGPRPGAGVASASGPAPPLAVLAAPGPAGPRVERGTWVGERSPACLLVSGPSAGRPFHCSAAPLAGRQSRRRKCRRRPRAIPHLLLQRRLPRPGGRDDSQPR